jgi:hypothetical protein
MEAATKVEDGDRDFRDTCLRRKDSSESKSFREYSRRLKDKGGISGFESLLFSALLSIWLIEDFYQITEEENEKRDRLRA